MSEKTISENPKITDIIILEIETPDADGCFSENPYKVDNVTIYYVERNFSTNNHGHYEKSIVRDDSLEKLRKAQKDYCDNPTENNKNILDHYQMEIVASSDKFSFYYNDAKAVQIVGNELNPAWLSTDLDNAFIINVNEDENGDVQYGHFKYAWNPAGKVREGDYFVCWTWTPNYAGDRLSSHLHFNLEGDPRAVTTIPSHITPEEKYDVLLDRYLPEMYKGYLSENDITPETLQKFNQAIAKGFKGIEDLANQVIDLMDANALHESLLVYLSNLFNLRLKSNDPTLWRRQIKEAVPLFKKKGTFSGLQEAFGQSGMSLVKMSKLWQVISPYTWQESFLVEDPENLSWRLKKNVISPIDPDNFEIAIRKVNESSYSIESSGDVEFSPSTCNLFTDVTWVGSSLEKGDIVRVLYQYNVVPSGEQSTEDYIRELPLADLRDEREQRYPLKNWNVRVIEEDDLLFDTIIPVKHPYHDPLVFGWIRTEFPYSENIYNMDSYNGCVIGTTRILSSSGFVEIGNSVGKSLKLLTEQGFRTCEVIKSQGVKDTLEITTKMGRSVTVSHNHEFRVMGENGKLHWKRAETICPGDYLLGRRGDPNLKLSLGGDKNAWYMAGLIYGDGYLNRNILCLMVPESQIETKNIFEEYLQSISAKFNVLEITPEEHRKYISMNCNMSMWRITTSRFQAAELGAIIPPYQRKGLWKRHVPDSLWKAGEEQTCSFLRGLFDTDGGVQGKSVTLTSKHKTLCEDVQLLFLRLGILSSITNYKVPYKEDMRTYYRVSVIGSKSISLFIEKIGFRLQSKHQYLIEVNSKKIQENLGSDRTVIPYADQLIHAIFPTKNRKSQTRQKLRNREEKRILTLITRLKQGCVKAIPDNCVSRVLDKALEFGEDLEAEDFLQSYVENGWFFDKVKSITSAGPQEVFDPVNVSETRSYLTNGLVSHNSTRESGDPCHIDKDFIDPCGSCLGSKYNLEVGIEDISDDRIQEVRDILKEYAPFHAFVHSINFTGEVNEFVISPVEEIEILISYNFNETVLSGNANPFFHRVMPDGRSLWRVDRDQVAGMVVSVSGQTGTAYNDHVSLVSPGINLSKIGLKPPGSHVFEVLSPSSNSGQYQITNPVGHVAEVVSGVSEPVNGSMFTFKLSNIQYSTNSATINRLDLKSFKSITNDFVELGVTGLWDVENVSGYSGGVWQMVVSGTTYDVYTVLSDGGVVLDDPGGTLPSSTTSSLSFTLLNPNGDQPLDVNGDIVGVGTNGVMTVKKRGNIDLNASITTNDYVKIGDYVLYSGTEYKVVGIVDGNIQIDGYTGGSASGVTVQVRRRLANNAIGYFGYSGLRLQTSSDYESALGILNGSNPPTVDEDEITDNSLWKENFLVLIGSKYYKISEIDGDEMVLEGEQQDWKTLGSGGTSVTYAIHHFVKDTVEAQFMVFDQIDRGGKDPVIRELYSTETEDVAVIALQVSEENELKDFVKQEEGVSFIIEYKNGEKQEGEIV